MEVFVIILTGGEVITLLPHVAQTLVTMELVQEYLVHVIVVIKTQYVQQKVVQIIVTVIVHQQLAVVMLSMLVVHVIQILALEDVRVIQILQERMWFVLVIIMNLRKTYHVLVIQILGE
jgi:hypothetical protein